MGLVLLWTWPNNATVEQPCQYGRRFTATEVPKSQELGKVTASAQRRRSIESERGDRNEGMRHLEKVIAKRR